jgi:hypothetical protein
VAPMAALPGSGVSARPNSLQIIGRAGVVLNRRRMMSADQPAVGAAAPCRCGRIRLARPSLADADADTESRRVSLLDAGGGEQFDVCGDAVLGGEGQHLGRASRSPVPEEVSFFRPNVRFMICSWISLG